MIYIKSKENQFFKKLKSLKIKKYRDEYREFLVEGVKIFDFIENFEFVILKESKKNIYDNFWEYENCYILSDNIFDEISSQSNSQGIIFGISYLDKKINFDVKELVVLDNIQDPGNLGTIIRVLDAVGIENLILTKGSCDIYNEKVVRSTMGSLFNLNIEYLSLTELSEILKKNNFNILSTALSKESISYEKMNLQEKNAIVFGNEGHGVSEEILKISNEKVIIPIYGKAESLNVALASGIFLYKYRELKNNLD